MVQRITNLLKLPARQQIDYPSGIQIIDHYTEDFFYPQFRSSLVP
ncbi:MAG: hypothetical protein RLZZ262_1365 [Bacteroidota bacterium]|jgi:hypothetical protein